MLGGDLTTFRGPEHHRTAPPPLPPPDDCPALTTDFPPAPKLMDAVEVRMDPATSACLRGETGAEPEMNAWLRFRDGRPADTLALVTFADVLPPTTFNQLGITGWVPTLELTVQVRRRPAPGWIRLRAITRHLSAGHIEEDGELWDEQDQLVAISRQRAMLR